MLDFSNKVAGIGGWLCEAEGNLLYDLARKVSFGQAIVEIGSWKGRSTACLGQGSKDGNLVFVYAIDPHTGSPEHRRWFGKVDTYQEFLKNISDAGVSEYIKPIKETSETAAEDFNLPIGLLFIDGEHGLAAVRLDYDLWFPKVVDDGKIIFHDSWHSFGVQALSAWLLLTSPHLRNPVLVETATVVEKVKRNTLRDRIINVLFVLSRFCSGWLGTIHLDCGGTFTK